MITLPFIKYEENILYRLFHSLPPFYKQKAAKSIYQGSSPLADAFCDDTLYWMLTWRWLITGQRRTLNLRVCATDVWWLRSDTQTSSSTKRVSVLSISCVRCGYRGLNRLEKTNWLWKKKWLGRNCHVVNNCMLRDGNLLLTSRHTGNFMSHGVTQKQWRCSIFQRRRAESVDGLLHDLVSDFTSQGIFSPDNNILTINHCPRHFLRGVQKWKGPLWWRIITGSKINF